MWKSSTIPAGSNICDCSAAVSSRPYPPGISATVNVVSQVNSIYANKAPVRLRASQQGQVMVEYAMILAAIIGLLVFVSGFGLVTARVLNWISNHMF